MKFQFYRFYALIILAAALLVWSFNSIYEATQTPNSSYQVEVDDLIQRFHHDSDLSADKEQRLPTFEIIQSQTLALPEDLAAMLEQGKTIAIADNNNRTFYYKKNDAELLTRFGPFEHQSNDSQFEPYVIPLFYSSLACLLLFLMRPIFRDLQQLQQDALEFGRKPVAMQRSIKESSNIYPLANSFYGMSNKILNFIQMNKDLSRTISHEIRTPLARMKFMLEIIEPNISANQKMRMKNDIAEIESLVNDYLSFAKVENETDNIHREFHCMKTFLQEIYDKFSIYQDQILIDCHSEDVQAYFDKGSMSIAVQNLLTNALRFSKEKISLDFYLDQEQCLLSVEDDGPGVGDNAAKLMQPFSRENAKEQNHKGFGLGLYIVRKVAIWHEGEFTISQSSKLGGAKMQIRWPNQSK
ncbi:ATP-binding protein [Kangiella sp. TOML190]|uniref:ATP-binding protein n=1 Tax=Kangiella sp. TOML190 TaxID=2931351 RepID=UPI00203C25C4|nr:ATP-binding protein [Kangiella sp. TOML190]